MARVPIFNDFAQMLRNKQRSGTGFFAPAISAPLLNLKDSTEIAERVSQATAKYSCSEQETKFHIGLVSLILRHIPEPRANHPRELVELFMTGLPCYKAPQAGIQKKSK